MNIKELINQLPYSYDTLSFGQWLKIIDIELVTKQEEDFSNLDNTVRIASAILDIPVSELEARPLAEIILLDKRLSFLNQPHMPSKTSLKWKDIDTTTYDDFVWFIDQKDKTDLLGFCNRFLQPSQTEEEILELSTQDVLSGFFLLRKQLRIYIQDSIKLEKKKLKKIQKHQAQLSELNKPEINK